MPSGREADKSPNWLMQARAQLALRRAEKPATKASQIRALWPDIEAALAVGQSMKTIREWLAQDAGITLGVTSLTSYVSRIRRREKRDRLSYIPIGQPVRPELGSAGSSPEARPPIVPGTEVVQSPDDPLAQAMRVLSKPKMDIRKIHNDGDPDGRNLI